MANRKKEKKKRREKQTWIDGRESENYYKGEIKLQSRVQSICE